jgi:Tol biopolymer transport system component
LGGGGLDVIEVPGGASLRVFDGDVNAAVWSPDGAQIAFSRWGNGPEGVYVVNRDGGELRELSTKGTHVIEWSGTGKRLAFFRDEHVYLLDVDSGQTVDIPDVVDFSFAWSPQGTEVAFANDSGLHVYDAKEGALRQIADGPSDGFVLWSPDGSRIIFPFGPQVPFAHNPEVGIQAPYVVGAQGDTEPTPLPVASTISWSPDGSRIAYLEFGCVTGAWDIYTVAPDGGSPRPVTRTPETVKEGPYWSPTGTAIAYSTFGQIILLDVESGVAQTLVSSDPTAGGDMHLHGSPWSPDGRYIQFTAGTAHGICD